MDDVPSPSRTTLNSLLVSMSWRIIYKPVTKETAGGNGKKKFLINVSLFFRLVAFGSVEWVVMSKSDPSFQLLDPDPGAFISSHHLWSYKSDQKFAIVPSQSKRV